MDRELLIKILAHVQRQSASVQVSVLMYDLNTSEGRDAIREEIRSLCEKMVEIGEAVGL
jgi:hypothetical protein